MEYKQVLKRTLGQKIWCRLVVVLLILSMVLLTGCNDKKTDSSKSEGNSSASQGNESNVSSDDLDLPSDTEISTDGSAKVDPLSGEFSFEETTSNINDNINEIIPSGNTANLSNPLDGYFSAEAEALRKDILSTSNTEKYYKITGTKYYVSSKGDDSNSGLSPKEAIKSVDGISGLGLKSGDAVLFERGSVFRLYTAILAVDGVTYGSYGEGEKPKFYTSPLNFANVVWTPTSKKNVWQIDWVYADAGSMIFNHGKEIGYKKTSMRNLEKNTDFFQDNSTGVMYLYCDKGNPAKVYESIEVGVRMSMLNIPSGTDNVIVDNLCFKYGGIFAVNATWNTSNVTVTNCEMGYIGGCTVGDGSGRYGNAIQFWTGAKNIICDHNWIYQTFDTAVSWQGNGGYDFSYSDISFSDNLLEYNNADYEYWAGDGAYIKNFKMENNIMRFTALGWGTRLNDAGSRGIEGCFVGHTDNMSVDNISIKNTIIDCPGRFIINWNITPADKNTEIIVSNTKIYVNSSYRNTDEVLRGYKDADSDPNQVRATNADEFVTALKKFDSKAVLQWY